MYGTQNVAEYMKQNRYIIIVICLFEWNAWFEIANVLTRGKLVIRFGIIPVIFPNTNTLITTAFHFTWITYQNKKKRTLIPDTILNTTTVALSKQLIRFVSLLRWLEFNQELLVYSWIINYDNNLQLLGTYQNTERDNGPLNFDFHQPAKWIEFVMNSWCYKCCIHHFGYGFKEPTPQCIGRFNAKVGLSFRYTRAF